MYTTRQFGLSIRSTYVLSFLVFALRDIVTLTVELSVDKLTAAYSMQ